MGAHVRGEVVDHAHRNRQVKIRLPVDRSRAVAGPCERQGARRRSTATDSDRQATEGSGETPGQSPRT